MTELDLDDLKAKALAATPGPWESWNVDDETIEVRAGSALTGTGSYRSTDMIVECDVDGYEPDEPDFRQREADADHIAAFGPPTVLALIERVERAEAQLAAIRVARSSHPECDKDESTCGWKRVVQDIDAALSEESENTR